MIEVNNLKKNYKVKVKSGLFSYKYLNKEAVKDISLKIPEGKIIGLLGVNGSGKTTTIKMISTLLTPDGGTGFIDSMDILKEGKKIRKKINMICSGERMIYLRLTPKENLEYFGNLYNLEKKELNIKIKELLEYVGLQDNINQPVETFSKGMKQRLQIARGLINNPKYILLDEPTLGLDAPMAHQVRELCKKLAYEKNKGILLTSHYIKEIEELCDYVYIIDNGSNLIEGTPIEIIHKLSNYKEKNIITVEILSDQLEKNLIYYCQVNNIVFSIDKLNNTIIFTGLSSLDLKKIISFVSEETVILSLSSKMPTLEEVILNLDRSDKSYETCI